MESHTDRHGGGRPANYPMTPGLPGALPASRSRAPIRFYIFSICPSTRLPHRHPMLDLHTLTTTHAPSFPSPFRPRVPVATRSTRPPAGRAPPNSLSSPRAPVPPCPPLSLIPEGLGAGCEA